MFAEVHVLFAYWLFQVMTQISFYFIIMNLFTDMGILSDRGTSLVKAGIVLENDSHPTKWNWKKVVDTNKTTNWIGFYVSIDNNCLTTTTCHKQDEII